MNSSEMNPLVFWGIIGVVVLVALGAGYFFLGSSGYRSSGNTSTEEVMQQVEQTGTFYSPPAGAPVPGAPPR